tara:strand:- start:1369 stop:1542 length:174 start_codon:yes stop_codon:yes gene_type:complete
MNDKKIKLVDNEQSTEDIVKTMLKTMEAMDWKLWELYQTAQRIEKYLGINEDKNEEQ